MRKLMYFTIGFGGTCAICAYAEGMTLRLMLCAALLLFGAAAGKNARTLYRVVLVFAGCLAGMAWFCQYDARYLEAARAMDGMTQLAEIRVSNYSRKTDYGTSVDGTLILEGKPYQIRVYLTDQRDLTPGDYLYGSFRFRCTTPEALDASRYYQGMGTFLLGYQEDTVTAVDYAPTRRDLPARIRNKVRNILAESFQEDTAPFAKALLIGDTSDISYEIDTDLKISGIRHVVAVSGLHISILFALLGTVTLHRKWLMAFAGIPVLGLFAAVAGFTPSVTRACIMSGLMLLAMLASREYDGATALSFSVLVILTANPLAVTSVSFQLSVASVAGIYLFDGRIRKWMTAQFGEIRKNRIKAFIVKWFTSSVSVSLSAMTLTAPLCAWYFGTVSLIGPVTNLLTLWVISFIFYGIMAVCGIYLVFPGAATVLAKGISVPIRYVLLISGVMAEMPMAAVYTVSLYITAWLVFVYLLLVLFLFSSNRKPKTLGCCAVIGLCLALLAGWTENLLATVQFTVLDVGQGQCLLFQTEGRNFLVDCGGDSDAAAADLAAETLLSQGISRLDGMILTHLDRDHAGAAENFLSRIETDLLILPAVYSELERSTDADVIYATQDLQLAFGTAKIQIYHPTFPGNSNEMSLCILFDTEKCDILVTGDRSGFGERALLRYADIPDVDILVAGHHGSRNSTCEELLAAVRPETVCISVGAGNSYGHPAPELLQRLQAHGCAVYRTDKHGTITIRR